jgi:hypothetical protein
MRSLAWPDCCSLVAGWPYLPNKHGLSNYRGSMGGNYASPTRHADSSEKLAKGTTETAVVEGQL